MIDRSDCVLHLVGTTSQKAYDGLKNFLLEQHGEERAEGIFRFEDVPYGQCNHGEIVESYGLSWIWRNEGTSEYDPGITCHNFDAQTYASMTSGIDGIMIPLSKAGDASYVARLLAWDAWIDASTFKIADTAHEKTAHQARMIALVEAGRIPADRLG